MKCIDKKKLSAFLDGELTEQERAAIQEHLKDCADCRQEAHNFAAVSNLLGVWEGIEPEPYFTVRVKQRIANEKPEPRAQWLRKIFIPVGASAAGVLAFVLGLFLGKAMHQKRTQLASESTAESAYMLRVDAVKDFPEGSLGDVFSEIVEGGNK